MRTAFLIFGVATILTGTLALAMAAVLVNQRLHIVRSSWGIFDVQAGGAAITNSTACAAFAAVGMALIALGVALARSK